MGSVLRDTGAFFMRRTYNDDILYWETFKQYIYQIVTKGEDGIEFFIEGTRSRSGKSLVPKYGRHYFHLKLIELINSAFLKSNLFILVIKHTNLLFTLFNKNVNKISIFRPSLDDT